METKEAENVCEETTKTAHADSVAGIDTKCKMENSESFSSVSESEGAREEGTEVGWKKQTFTVWYLGSALMHRLYTQSLQPWVMAEVKRKRDGIKEVNVEVGSDGFLRAKGRDPSGQETGETILEHHLQGLSRFARLHQDPRCFAYLTRTQLGTDYICHVYLATSDNTISELFSCIREATRDLHLASSASGSSSMGEGSDLSENDKATFEIRYLGRARVQCRKLASEAVDALAERLMAWEEAQRMKQLREKERRQRHASGASIKSLPASLDEEVSIMENNLGDQLDRLRRGANVAASHAGHFPDESGDSSADDLASGGEMSSSSENILEFDHHHHHHNHPAHQQRPLQQQQQHRQPLAPQAQLGHHHHSFHSVTLDKQSSLRGESMDSVEEHGMSTEDVFDDGGGAHPSGASCVMLLQISHQCIGLISLHNKQPIMERHFKDIASVSQGNHKKDVFGLIVREPESSALMAYVLNCHSEVVVNEIMNTLQTAFMSAYQKTSSHQQVCAMCPLHQLHRLCQDVTKLSPQSAHELLVKRIEHLPDRDVTELSLRVKMERPTTYEESVEVMMIALRQLCEQRQREHSHVADGARPSKHDMNLLDDRQRFVLFEGLRNKAKKSLANSFENLIRTRKREDAKDSFRQRSWTTDMEATGSWANRSRSSSMASTPDASPLTSPTLKHGCHEFPSPPGSPAEPRKRSSTLGCIQDSAERERAAAKQRLRDVNHNTTKTSTHSPLKTMYLLASSPNFPESNSSSPMTSPQEEAAAGGSTPQSTRSWRKAIFEQVCTPTSHHDASGLDHEGEAEKGGNSKKKTPAELRALWKKAMLETLLLIRMEKENSDVRDYFIFYGSRSIVVFRARQEEQLALERKLDYEELTPCLKDVSRVWDDLLHTAAAASSTDGPHTVLYDTLLDCVKKGVPRSQRGSIWKFLSQQQCLHGAVNTSQANISTLSYEDLLKQLTTQQHAILIDLGRTFPGHPYFAKALGPGQLELFNLLKAYSLLDTEVGYCQGISFIAGILLMHMEEKQAFELTRHLMIGLNLRKQYCPNMMALQVKLYQLMRLIHDHYKDLYTHFETHEIAPALYATPWFLTLFASQFPLGFVARVFDMIFIQGSEVIFKVALMLLGSHRELILQCDSFEGIVEFLKTTLPEMAHVQMERVINQAFELDISKQLQAYEVEYLVFSEEMVYSPRVNHHPGPSPSAHGHPAVVALQQTVRRLRQQNLELIEKVQRCNSQVQGLQMAAHEHRVNEDKLKSRVQALELERAALLSAVGSLKALIPEDQRDNIPHLLQMQSLSASSTLSSPALGRREVGGKEGGGGGGGSVRAGEGEEGPGTASDTTDTVCATSSSSDRE
ncbi:TBC1 domain family member 1-like isoform X2 [Babylonia areolata]|uniref:TBC1 domain family member 1-like isoform X2 n=1 Tax=Babylonia areolata TaxID=304850 RepID=UPI003FD19E37